MKSKIAILCVLALAAGLLVFVGTGLSASAPKATGGVGFTVTGETLQRWVEFQVQVVSGDTAKGMLNYHDADGNWYKADLQCLTVVGDFAFFSGSVVKSRPETWVGKCVQIAVHDGGTPGSNGDQIWGTFPDPDQVCWCGPRYYPKPIPWWTVTSGNLVVH